MSFADLVGKKIEKVKEVKNELRITLDDKSVLIFTEQGAPGADGGWYVSAVLKIKLQNGEIHTCFHS